VTPTLRHFYAIIMLSVRNTSYAECHYAEFHFVGCYCERRGATQTFQLSVYNEALVHNIDRMRSFMLRKKVLREKCILNEPKETLYQHLDIQVKSFHN
jgi:hypothetical protein